MADQSNRTRRNLVVAGCSLLLPFSAMRAAAPPWLDKKPNEWNPRDFDDILYRSAWVRDVALEMERGKKEGNRRQSGAGSVAAPFRVLVRWESSFPVRFAQGIPAGPAQINPYQISIIRVPVEYLAHLSSGTSGDAKAEVAGRIARTAKLQCPGKQPLAATDARWIDTGLSSKILISLPTYSEPLRIEDREVVFTCTVGSFWIRASFNLREMVYRGRLEL